MGKRGPAPQPTKILKLKSSWRGDIKPDEITVDSVIPDMPEWLPKKCEARWDYVCKHLHAIGIIGMVDRDALGQYCWLWMQLEIAMEENEKMGNTDMTSKGDTKIGAHFKAAMELSDKCKQMAREFGLTPSSRTAFSAHIGKKDQKKAGLSAYKGNEQTG